MKGGVGSEAGVRAPAPTAEEAPNGAVLLTCCLVDPDALVEDNAVMMQVCQRCGP